MSHPNPRYNALISYSHKDSQIVEQIYQHLRKADRKIWKDDGDILPAADWWDQIQLGMRNADNVIFMMSAASLASVVCQQELDYARELNKRIIPVILDETASKAETQREARISLAAEELDDTSKARRPGRDIVVIAKENIELLNSLNWIWCTDADNVAEAVGKIRDSLNEDADYHRYLTSYTQAALTWEANAESPDRLLQGDEIQEAEDWQATAELKQLKVPVLVERFIAASRADDIAYQLEIEKQKNERKSLERRKQLFRNIAVVVGLVLGLVAVVAASRAIKLWQLRELAQVEMVEYDTATVELGESPDDSLFPGPLYLHVQAKQSVTVEAFELDIYEVSFANYALCVEAGACSETSKELNDPNPDWPVVGVDAFQSAAYCTWLGKRLPTRAEWERAARGDAYRTMPWEGETPDPPPIHMLHPNSEPMGRPMPVAVDSERFAGGATPEGVMHLLGNAQEWTATPVEPECDDPYRCDAWDGIKDVVALYTIGFPYGDMFEDDVVRLGAATWSDPGVSNVFVGFRCARTSH